MHLDVVRRCHRFAHGCVDDVLRQQAKRRVGIGYSVPSLYRTARREIVAQTRRPQCSSALIGREFERACAASGDERLFPRENGAEQLSRGLACHRPARKEKTQAQRQVGFAVDQFAQVVAERFRLTGRAQQTRIEAGIRPQYSNERQEPHRFGVVQGVSLGKSCLLQQRRDRAEHLRILFAPTQTLQTLFALLLLPRRAAGQQAFPLRPGQHELWL